MSPADFDPPVDFKSHEKTIQDIVHLFEKKKLNLSPGFQRSSVWNESDRRKLIDSMPLNYPLPALFFYRRTQDDGNIVYDVIDGKQRLESVLMFTGAVRGSRFWTHLRLPKAEAAEWLNCGQTELSNAALMCRKHNSAKQNR